MRKEMQELDLTIRDLGNGIKFGGDFEIPFTRNYVESFRHDIDEVGANQFELLRETLGIDEYDVDWFEVVGELYRKRIVPDGQGNSIITVAMDTPKFFGYNNPFDETKLPTTRAPNIDGVIVTDPNIPLYCAYSDCPWLFVQADELFGAIHLSRRNLDRQFLLGRFLKRFYSTLGRSHISSDKLILSPHICPESYFYENLDSVNHQPWIEAEAVNERDKGWTLNLQKMIEYQLEENGIGKHNLDTSLVFDTYDRSMKSHHNGGIVYSHKYRCEFRGDEEDAPRTGRGAMIMTRFDREEFMR